MIKTIRLSAQAKDHLIRLKTRTGVQQWNTLCRWAFCISLKEPTIPTPIDIPLDSNVEMSWHVFGGEYQEVFLTLLKERCYQDGLDLSEENLVQQFKLHLHRGINYLATPNVVRSIADLIKLALHGENT